MSAAATAAGYLYASGRLRGRAAREQEQQHQAREPEKKPVRKEPVRTEVRVAVLPEREEAPAQQPKKAPRIEYRRRRWAPE